MGSYDRSASGAGGGRWNGSVRGGSQSGLVRRRQRRSVGLYPMDADACKARDAVSAARVKHLKAAADVQEVLKVSQYLLKSGKARFDGLLRAISSAKLPHRGNHPSGRCAKANGRTGPTAIGSPNSVPEGQRSVVAAPISERRFTSFSFEFDAGTNSTDSFTDANMHKYYATNRQEAGGAILPGAAALRYRLTDYGDWSTGVGASCLKADRVRNAGDGGRVVHPIENSSEQQRDVVIRDGLSLVPHTADRSSGTVPITRMYRDKPTLTKEQARKLKLIAKLEDKELDSLKPFVTQIASGVAKPPSDVDSQQSSDRSQAGSRLDATKERHWVDSITVSSRCTDEGRTGNAEPAGDGNGATHNATAATSLPTCICPSSEQKSRLFCVKRWLMQTDFTRSSRARPIL